MSEEITKEKIQPPKHKSSLETTAQDHLDLHPGEINPEIPEAYYRQKLDLPLFDIIGPQKAVFKLNLLLSQLEDKDFEDQWLKLKQEYDRSMEYIKERGFTVNFEDKIITNIIKTKNEIFQYDT